MVKNSSEIDQAIGAKIKIVRIAAGYSTLDISKQLNIDNAQYISYEEGQYRFEAAILHQLCKILEITPSVVFSQVVPTKH